MFEITLIAMGKLKEKFYLSAASEYAKRLSGYCRFSLVELPEYRLPDNPSPAEIQTGLEKEADVILSKIPKNTWFCVFTPEGAMLSSGRTYMREYPHLVLYPGFAIVITVLAFNMLGDGLRDALDPRLKK